MRAHLDPWPMQKLWVIAILLEKFFKLSYSSGQQWHPRKKNDVLQEIDETIQIFKGLTSNMVTKLLGNFDGEVYNSGRVPNLPLRYGTMKYPRKSKAGGGQI